MRSVLQPQVKGLAELRPVRLAVGTDFDLGDLTSRAGRAAYIRVDLVERRGEFAVRGGIVDIFPPTEEHPVRVDFFGDTVEEIHYFSVADQRSSDLTPDRGHRLAVPRTAADRRRSAPGPPRWPSSTPS